MVLKNIFLFIIFTSLVGCASWVESAKNMISKDSKKSAKKKVSWVSKNQYDELLVKYKNLSDAHEALKRDRESESKFDQIDELSSNILEDEIENTSPVPPKKKVSNVPVIQELPESGVKKSLNMYKKAVTLKENGKFKEALALFQTLERTNFDQIKVRARYQIAEIYFSQNQFDLSLQVYESIINENSFSSKVIDALKGAISCSNKLQLASKSTRYQSILQDFFGIKG